MATEKHIPPSGWSPSRESRPDDEERKWLGYPISEWVLATISGLVGGGIVIAATHWWGKWAVVLVILGIALLFLLVYALIGLIRLLSDLFGGRL